MSTVDERNINPIHEMRRLSNDFLDLDSWQFKETYLSEKPAELIYDSEWCRLNLTWGGWDPNGGNTISVYYGRLHAPNSKSTMTWMGEECHCWHRFEHALHFLDERPPLDAVKLNYSHPLISSFFEADFRQRFRRRQPEWLLRMHATVWESYGKGLFKIFDLRQPELWEQYRRFLKQFYDIKGRSPAIRPPLDKVC